MKANHLLEELEFHEADPFAQPILVDKDVRILRWMLKPGQSIREHRVPSSPLYVVVIKGRGMFASNGEAEQEFGPNSLLIFEANESHTVRALGEALIFVAFLQAVPTTQTLVTE
jgi:quercetin dioxygenase-like cupin family protein